MLEFLLFLAVLTSFFSLKDKKKQVREKVRDNYNQSSYII